MKHLLKYSTVLFTVVLSVLATTSCDKKDEPVNITDEPEIVAKAQLSSLTIDGSNTIQFTYDTDNRLKYIKEIARGGETTSDFAWNPFSIVYRSTIPTSGPNAGYIVATLSAQKYITSAYVKEYPSEIVTFEYDKSGHIVKMVIDDKEYQFHDEYTYTWRNDLLISAIRISREESYTDKKIFHISYGDTENASGIWPFGFWSSYTLFFEVYELDIPAIPQTGLLGVAPSKLPVRIDIEYSSDDDYSSDDTERYEFSYDLNAQGYVSKERINGYYNGKLIDTENVSYNYR